MIKYLLYVLRWVVLAIPGAMFFNKVREILNVENVYVAMVISQALMGAMVYFLDRLIFTSGAVPVPWETKQRGTCADCGRVGLCYRVAGTRCCDPTRKDPEGVFRCERCAVRKIEGTDI
jgi:hypothetical protein